MDAAKDQTYFLHAVHRSDLSQALMPLGEYTKAQVRARARAAGLPVFDKPDSTGICFIGERPFREFLRQYLDETPGRIESPRRRVAGDASAAWRSIPWGSAAGWAWAAAATPSPVPWYVAAKDATRNVLIAVQGHDHPLLCARELHCENLHWLVTPPSGPRRCTVRVRHRHTRPAGRAAPRNRRHGPRAVR